MFFQVKKQIEKQKLSRYQTSTLKCLWYGNNFCDCGLKKYVQEKLQIITNYNLKPDLTR